MMRKRFLANIDLQNQHKIVPKQGVYLVKSNLEDRIIYGMMNIGTKPTFNAAMPSIEVHFFDWNGNLYGQAVQVELLKWVREERKFNNVEELQTQIQADEQYCRSSIPTSHVSYK